MNDLGKDKVGRLLFRLAAPAIAAQLVNALYNIVDRIYIGRIPNVGAEALTGVGITFPIIVIITAFSALVGMGGAPLASIKMGQGDNDGAEQIMTNSFVMLIIMSAVLTAIFSILKRPMLYAFGASDRTISYAESYLSIYLIGTLFVQLTVGMNAFITSQGFARTSMATVLIGAALNIALDPLFIFVLGLGVRGAALATVISQCASALWVLIFLFGKRTVLRIRKKYLRLKARVVFGTMSLGVSPFIMQSTESLVTIALNSTLQRYGGDMAVGSMTIITSIMQFALMPIQGLIQGAQPISSYNFGAKNFSRVREVFRLLLISCMTFTVFFTLVCELFPRAFAFIFTDNAELANTAGRYLRIFVGGTWMMGAQMACQNTFLSLGQAKVSLMLALLRKIVLLIPLVYILSAIFGTIGVFWAQPAADILAATTTSTVFALKFGKILRKAGENG
jgi:putative MATE family efflux protein